MNKNNVKNWILSGMTAIFALAANVFSSDTDTAYVPIAVTAEGSGTVNVSVKVQSPNGNERTYSLESGKQEILALPLSGFSSVSYHSQRRTNAPAAVNYSRGKLSLQLNPQQFQNAEISLLSVNGKRVWRTKAAASKSTFKTLRTNIAAGVYLLSVKYVNGNVFENRLTHCGGKLNINVTFGGEDLSSLRKSANSADIGIWTITASVARHDTISREFTPAAGINQPQIIALPLTFALIEKEHWGLIENDTARAAALSNSRALQRAIDTLTRRGNTKLKLEKGDYCIWGADDRNRNTVKVAIPSNVEFDLNESTLRLASNAEVGSRLFEIRSAENIKIFNGTLIGDRDTHDYGRRQGTRATYGQSPEWASHEFGMGIWIAASKNIELHNLTIKDVTGDCIFIGYKSSNITIHNNKLSRARRDGIVAADCDGLIIRNNHIFDIYNDITHRDENNNTIWIGAEACIAFEADYSDGRERITNVQIHDNTLDGSRGRWRSFLDFYWGVENVQIRNNHLIGDFGLKFGNNILFENNQMYNGIIHATGSVNTNNPTINSVNVIIRNNDFFDTRVYITGGAPAWVTDQGLGGLYNGWRQNYALINNKFINRSAAPTEDFQNIIISANIGIAIIDNTFETAINRYTGIGVYIGGPPPGNPEYVLYIADNTIPLQRTNAAGFSAPKRYQSEPSGTISAWLGENEILHSDLQRVETLNNSINLRGLPDWYKETNNREKAIEFINSFIWF